MVVMDVLSSTALIQLSDEKPESFSQRATFQYQAALGLLLPRPPHFPARLLQVQVALGISFQMTT